MRAQGSVVGRKRVFAVIVAITVLFITTIYSVPMSVAALPNDVLGIENGCVYYIKNVSTGHYLDVEGGAPARVGQNVIGYPFVGGANQKWEIRQAGGGKYKLVSLLGSAGYVLDVNGSNVDIWPGNYPLDQHFTLSSDGNGKYYIRLEPHGNYYVTEDSSGGNVQATSASGGTRSVWSLEKVQKGDADFYSFKYSGFDTTGAASNFKSRMSGMGYSSFHLTNYSAADAYEYMQYDDVWVFSGHGFVDEGVAYATAMFDNASGSYNGYLTANSSIFGGSSSRAIDSLPANALAFERCILYMGCKTGLSYNGYNLINSTYSKGAHFVLGTKDYTTVGSDDRWLAKFFDTAATGATIMKCIFEANYYAGYTDIVYYKGDVYAKLK